VSVPVPVPVTSGGAASATGRIAIGLRTSDEMRPPAPALLTQVSEPNAHWFTAAVVRVTVTVKDFVRPGRMTNRFGETVTVVPAGACTLAS
jgi:hypothetical protein